VLKKLQAHIRPNPIGEPNSQTAIITDRGRFDLFSRLTTATGCQRISIASDFFGSSLIPSFAILEAEPTDPRPERNDDPHAYERDGRSVQDFSPGPGRVERDLNYRKSHHKHRVKPSENDRNTPQYPYPCGVFSAVFVRQIDVVRWSAHAVILAADSREVGDYACQHRGNKQKRDAGAKAGRVREVPKCDIRILGKFGHGGRANSSSDCPHASEPVVGSFESRFLAIGTGVQRQCTPSPTTRCHSTRYWTNIALSVADFSQMELIG
jgi:hypothetical protein